jgi:hypothetical protein
MRTEETNNNFIIDLPFEYRRAVLTQARTRKYGAYAFIAEFHDGSRKFIKGPYKGREKAGKQVICNEIKRRLGSVYLHPIECEIEEYGDGTFYLVCEELGRADLENTEVRTTKIEVTFFEVLIYSTDNDLVPNPFEYIKEINEDNKNIWVQIIVNYCFRWIFGIGDAARRNLMLQRSTGRIYSIDEDSIDSGVHKSIWHGQPPGKEVISLVRTFAQDEELLNIVLNEVRRWKLPLRGICEEFNLSPVNMGKRIDMLLRDPSRVLVSIR